jgi:sulfatase modifying factor 1
MGIDRQGELASVPGGEFAMGSDHHYPEERPRRPVIVAPFEICATAITNREFEAFVDATGYQTTAEIPLQADEISEMPPEYFDVGSLVFRMSNKQVDLRDFRNWWRFVGGACWHAPEGPGSSISDRQDHPVVHVSIFDAQAFTEWAGLALPSEAEWEFAANAGVDTTYPWGDELTQDGITLANTWRGQFPWKNDRTNTPPFSMPVRSFQANKYGLYNMIGNVWEWTRDKYSDPHERPSPCCLPSGPKDGENFVVKGGSFLCAPSYCRRYRASARSPQEARSSASHLGFRCVRRE